MRATGLSRRGGEGEAARPIDYGPLDERLGYLLRRAQIAVFRDFFAAFAAHDIRPAQYAILTIVQRNPGLKQGEVGAALGVKRANIVGMIDELERRGLVSRDPSPTDRRSYGLALTDAGRALTPKLHALSGRHERRVRATVGETAYRGLFASLALLAAMDREPAQK